MKKYRPKHKFKLSAKVYSFVMEGNCLKLKLYKGLKSDPEVFLFHCYDSRLSGDVIRLIEGGVKRLDVRFTIKFKDWNGKLYPSLILVDAVEWLSLRKKLGNIEQNYNINPTFGENGLF